MCAAWSEVVEAHAKIADMSKPGAAPFSGHMIDHPRVILNRAFERWIKLSDRFGLSPAAKTRVRASGGEEENGDSRTSYFNAAG
jgi:phage terminase small subunit